MATPTSPGAKLREAAAAERPLQMPGVINAYHAMMAEASGYRAIYLSGSGVAGASYGLPDLGMTTLNDVAEDVRRITGASELPLLVDADTGWGNAFMINKAIKDLARAGAGGVHIEDQVHAKRCGHRPNKEVVSLDEMVDRITAAVDA
ncbi:MAG TPA: methylisocitrate lyase, partial [Dehalococcoidia bacterium]|nr:methylisocitrate lyase [Dehalococcoidia bacterium]